MLKVTRCAKEAAALAALMAEAITRKEVLSRALPLIVANATTPLLGLVDSAVLGHGGTPVDLAAISLGALVFNFLYWGFGFLRMTTTGFVAQAKGSGDAEELLAAVVRPVLLGALVGTMLLLAGPLIAGFALDLLSAGAAEEQAAAGYVAARLFGAPASLAGLGAMGLLIGLGKTKQFLAIQLVTNGLNMALDVFFVSFLSWGVRGVGVGTAIAEWAGAFLALGYTYRHFRALGASVSWSRVVERTRVLRTLKANSDVMIRTLLMIGGFSFFVDQGARLGTVTLAANHLLLQLISLSAFFLDGYAHVVESLVGAAKGAKNVAAFDVALKRTSEVALMSALTLAGGVMLLGPLAVAILTDLSEVRAMADKYLVPVAVYVAVSVAAFQLDGVYIGATETRLMRDTSAVSFATFIGLALFLVPKADNLGLWWSFVGYVSMRGITLFVFLSKLRRGIGATPPLSSAVS